MATVTVEKVGNGRFKVFLPGFEGRDVEGRRRLEQMLRSNGMPENRYPAFETELLRTGKASVAVYYGNYWQS